MKHAPKIEQVLERQASIETNQPGLEQRQNLGPRMSTLPHYALLSPANVLNGRDVARLHPLNRPTGTTRIGSSRLTGKCWNRNHLSGYLWKPKDSRLASNAARSSSNGLDRCLKARYASSFQQFRPRC